MQAPKRVERYAEWATIVGMTSLNVGRDFFLP